MDDATPDLGIGFLIDTGASYDELMRLQALMESAEVKIVREAASIERATGGMIKVGGQSAQISAVANETTRAARDIAREKGRAEKAGEALIRQLERESAAYGKSRDQIRLMKAEAAALAAEKAGNADLAARILKAEADINAKEFAALRAARHEAQAAAEDAQAAADKVAAAARREAQAIREAAFAHQMFEARARQGIAAMREQEAAARASAAAEADLAARAQRLIAEINPAAAAQMRFNTEMANARTLIAAGAISLDDYVEKLRLERALLDDTAEGFARVRGQGNAMAALAPQLQDVFTQVSMGTNVLSVLAIQGGQAAGQMTHLDGAAGKFASFMMSGWGLAITAGLLILGSLTKGLTDGADASGKLTLNLDIQKNSYDVLIKSVREYNETQRDAAALTRTATEEAKKQTLELIKQAKAQLAAAEAKYFDQGTSGKAADVKAALGTQVDIAQQRLIELRRNLQDIEKGLADQAIASALDKEVEITTRYGTEINKISAAYDNNTISLAKYRSEKERLLKLQEKELDAYRESQRLTNSTGVANRDARVGDMVALIKQLFPGAHITSTTGGQHAKDSDHYAGRAIDFVPGGGMKQYTTAEVEQILKNAGVDIRRNAKGTQQLFGPGRSASMPGDHDDHFHVAWQGSPDTSKVDEQKARALEEAKRAYEATVKAAQDYAVAQSEEALKTGLSAKQLRQYADAVAVMKAPTVELRKAITDAADARERAISAQDAKDFNTNVMQPLRDELALYGLVGPARELAALGMEKEAFLAKNMGDGIAVATARWEEYYGAKKALIDKDAAAHREAENIRRMREEMEALLDATRAAGDAISNAFGRGGQAIGDAINVLTTYQQRERAIAEQAKKDGWDQMRVRRENSQLALEGVTALFGASKDLFEQGSKGYRALAAAEKAFALVQLANTAVNVAAGAAKMFATLGPFAFPAVAAMIGVMASLGFSSGGKSNGPAPTNEGTGTVLGDSKAKSESITRALGQLREIDTAMLSYSRQMAASLHSIENQIGGVASLIVRNAEGITSTSNIKEGFNSNAGTVLAGVGMLLGGPLGAGIGALLTKIPIVGDILKGLFGTKTTVLGSGLYGGSQSLGSILSGGYDASTYVDIQKKKKLFGITTSNKTSTQYGAVDPALEQQFALILRSFNEALLAAAGPLGFATTEIQQRLNSFVFSLGKIDLRGLTGEQIEEKLTAVFGAAADNMARAAFPGFERFQKAGEGLFETLVRVASTAEVVTSSFALLGSSAQAMGLDAKIALADQFESLSALTASVDTYFSQYYTKEEQAAARTAQLAKVFQSLGLSLPTSLAGFRALVEAQDLTTEAGRSVYATLLQLAPAFADLQSAMEGAKSAADIAAERQDLERQLLELRGDTAALRALELAKLDASNRALQLEIWAIQDAQEAAKAAEELRKAWTSVGDSIMDEVRRIRGLSDTAGANTYAALLGQFNAATTAARGGDQDAAKSLPQLSQALLAAAADAATSRQELDRIRAQTAASLEATYGLLSGLMGSSTSSTSRSLFDALLESQPATAAINDNATDGDRFEELRAETAQLRTDLTAALAQIAANTGKVAKKLDDVTGESGGNAVAVEITSNAA